MAKLITASKFEICFYNCMLGSGICVMEVEGHTQIIEMCKLIGRLDG